MTAVRCLALVPAQGMFVGEGVFFSSNASLYAYDKYRYPVSEVTPASSILRLSDQSQLCRALKPDSVVCTEKVSVHLPHCGHTIQVRCGDVAAVKVFTTPLYHQMLLSIYTKRLCIQYIHAAAYYSVYASLSVFLNQIPGMTSSRTACLCVITVCDVLYILLHVRHRRHAKRARVSGSHA